MEKLGEKRVETTKEKPLKYYDFFYKYYLVIVLIWNIIALGINLKGVENISNAEAWSIPIGMLMSTAIIGNIVKILIPIKLRDELQLKTILGYRLVLFFLIFDYIFRITFSSLNACVDNHNETIGYIGLYVVIYLLLYSIWYIPNLVFFIKRKHLFVDRKVTSKTKKKAVEIKKDIAESNEVLQDAEDRVTEIKNEDIKRVTTKKGNKRGLFANKWRILGMVSIVVNVCLIGSLVFVYVDDRQDIDDLNDTVKSLKKSKTDVEAQNSKLINENWNMRSKVNLFDKHVVIVPENTRVYHRYDCIYCDKSSFLIFNDENAKAMGYRACSHCMK